MPNFIDRVIGQTAESHEGMRKGTTIEAARALIEADDVEDLLDEIDGFMTEKGYGPTDFHELNETGRRAERILDRIYYNN